MLSNLSKSMYRGMSLASIKTTVVASRMSPAGSADLIRQNNRSYVTINQTSSAKTGEPEKSVFISQSTDIWTNLALEDWILNSKSFDFENHRILLLYRNTPSVVFGSFQNPWTEVDLALAQEYDIPVVRRKSGGGCVYHDLGNLNCTFFSTDKGFDVKKSPVPNLELICRALKREFGIEGVVTENKDITVNGKKISGTAARKGKSAYHHCTLLINADLTKLSALLNPNTKGIVSRATKSTRSSVQNLVASNSDITFDRVRDAIGYEFLRTDRNGNDGGEEFILKQRGFQSLNPSNEWFPGIGQIRSELSSWEHVFGRTPEFTINREYSLANSVGSTEGSTAKLTMVVSKGRVVNVSVELPKLNNEPAEGTTIGRKLSMLSNDVKGVAFHVDLIRDFEAVLLKKDDAQGGLTSSAPEYEYNNYQPNGT